MPKVHLNWSKLRDKLSERDPKVVEDKYVGIDKTLVVAIEEYDYDETIPILSDIKLEQWILDRKNLQKQTDEHPTPTTSSVSFDPEPEPTLAKEVEEPEEPETTNVVTQTKDSIPVETITHAHDTSNESNRFRDELVFTNCEEDEFAKYKDDDDEEEETLLSRNLRKIRSNLPTSTTSSTSNNNPLLPNKPEQAPISQVKPIRQEPSPKNVDNNNHEQSVAKNQIIIPVEPNWTDTKKFIDQNQLLIAFKDLNHFKDKITNDKLVKSLLTDLITKCFQEDVTDVLDDSLKLIYQLPLYRDESDFWSELAMRFKRKLFTHTNIQNLKYKSQIEPTIIYANYQRIFEAFCKVVLDQNLTLKIPYQIFRFIDEPLRALEKPFIKPKSEIKVSPKSPDENKQNGNDKPQSTPQTKLQFQAQPQAQSIPQQQSTVNHEGSILLKAKLSNQSKVQSSKIPQELSTTPRTINLQPKQSSDATISHLMESNVYKDGGSISWSRKDGFKIKFNVHRSTPIPTSSASGVFKRKI